MFALLSGITKSRRSNRQVFSWMAPNWLEGLGKERTSGQGAWESLKKLQEVNGGTRSTETLDMKFFVVIALAGFMPLMLFISSVSNIFCESKHSFLFPCLLVLNSRSRCGLAKQQERRRWYYTNKCSRTMQCPSRKMDTSSPTVTSINIQLQNNHHRP